MAGFVKVDLPFPATSGRKWQIKQVLADKGREIEGLPFLAREGKPNAK
jgi:hypothetical protein